MNLLFPLVRNLGLVENSKSTSERALFLISYVIEMVERTIKHGNNSSLES